MDEDLKRAVLDSSLHDRNIEDERGRLDTARERSRQAYLHEREQKLLASAESNVEEDTIRLVSGEPFSKRQYDELILKRNLLDLNKEKERIEIQHSKRTHYSFPIYEREKASEIRQESGRYGRRQAPKESSSPHSELKLAKSKLPIAAFRADLVKTIERNPIVVLVGATGSGKTTQLPQYLYEAGFSKTGLIGITQPRRVAATSVAQRVALEMNSKLGNLVGYNVRFDDRTSSHTAIKYMTDGMLLREFTSTPDLSSYSVIIIDEAHERTVHTDVLFALLKDVSRYRQDSGVSFKLIISSATMDASRFQSYFDNAPVFNVPGRTFPVEVFYTPTPISDYVNAAVTTIIQIHTSEPLPGDILVFLTGQEEIEAAVDILSSKIDILRQASEIPGILIAPIYAALSSEHQSRIFSATPKGFRKVVIATNIAETSITIDGIVYVVDSGFIKQRCYDPRTSIDSLIVTPCSKASAEQRAGRAGRVSSGKCFRLYTQDAFETELDEHPVPEIQRSPLASIVLLLKTIGIDDLVGFDWMDRPHPSSLDRALELLYSLKAIDANGELSDIGTKMAEYPLEPQMSRALLASMDYGVVPEMLALIALLSLQTPTIFVKPSKQDLSKEDRSALFAKIERSRQLFTHVSGDHNTFLNVWREWKDAGFSSFWCHDHFIQYRTMHQALDIHDQLMALLSKTSGYETRDNLDASLSEKVLKAILCGFFANTSKLSRSGKSYQAIKKWSATSASSIHIHPGSTLSRAISTHDRLPPRAVVYHEIVHTSLEYMRIVSEIDVRWLSEIAPHYYSRENID